MSLDISIIIVNYNVKEYLSNLLVSIERARHNLNLEIFVVDNASSDGSKALIPNKFPDINYIYNDENLGFGRANNQAINKVSGKYTLLINPDTIISEDTLTKMFDHLENDSSIAAAGCKILNPDGTFAPESRRSIPSISSAAYKVLGLTSLFPKSKTFSKYYMGWLGEDEATEIEVLSGSFMFLRTSVLKDINGFDEQFFMYGEDIDLCYRIKKMGFKISYYPFTTIIHYKGESTKKGDLNYIRVFNKANYQFFKKHFSTQYSLLFKSLIYLAISFKGISGFFSSKFKKVKSLGLDILALNFSLITAYVIRFSFTSELEEKLNNLRNLEFFWINAILTGLFILFSLGSNAQTKDESVSNSLKNIIFSYIGVVFLTFFVRNLAFSRIVLALGLMISLMVVLAIRVYAINKSKELKGRSGKFKKTRILIIGKESGSNNLIDRINRRVDWHQEIVGYISPEESAQDASIGSLSQLKEVVRNYSIDHVYFIQDEVAHKTILEQISILKEEDLIFKIIPKSMDYILGKSNVEYIESLPVVVIDLPYNQDINRVMKRFFDIIISFPVVVTLFFFSLPFRISSSIQAKNYEGMDYFLPLEKAKSLNKYQMFKGILLGKLSMVGYPIHSKHPSLFEQKKGITGPIQLAKERIKSKEDQSRFEMDYIQNYSIWRDIDILIKSIFSEKTITDWISEIEEEI